MNLKPSYTELWSLIDGLEEDFHNFQQVRRLKAVGRVLREEQQHQVPA